MDGMIKKWGHHLLPKSAPIWALPKTLPDGDLGLETLLLTDDKLLLALPDDVRPGVTGGRLA